MGSYTENAIELDAYTATEARVEELRAERSRLDRALAEAWLSLQKRMGWMFFEAFVFVAVFVAVLVLTAGPWYLYLAAVLMVAVHCFFAVRPVHLEYRAAKRKVSDARDQMREVDSELFGRHVAIANELFRRITAQTSKGVAPHYRIEVEPALDFEPWVRGVYVIADPERLKMSLPSNYMVYYIVTARLDFNSAEGVQWELQRMPSDYDTIQEVVQLIDATPDMFRRHVRERRSANEA